DSHYEASEAVDNASLIHKGLVKKAGLVKILGKGEIGKSLSFKVAAVSASAKEKIEKAGGSVIRTETPEKK
ncbi:MAG: uL15 family ribosomal protein, partial [Treponema sp.]|nr:uL15 family ribosomal protein [Treponema sp.]